ncbi:MAG: DUF1786 family protein [Chloroflexi bacterium]|nr:DUF1786 family protein [Chloroflexota bacterium]
MRILAIDIGTGTQDVLLFEPGGPVENSPKFVVPSPTRVAEQRIREATAARDALVLTGVTAGGGPCHWALGDHLAAGLAAYATPDAARTFNDDLAEVEAQGVVIVSDDEATRLDGTHVTMRDLDLATIFAALAAFGVDTRVDGIAVGVLDHGAAPPGVSDRVFRFEHIARTLAADPDVRAFAYLADVPAYLTRARAVVGCADVDVPAVFMDTGPAAALGALHDLPVAIEPSRFVLNTGNMHSLGIVLDGTRVSALFEHHTGQLTPAQLAASVDELCAGTLTAAAVFESSGHGALYLDTPPFAPGIVAVTGPRRGNVLPLLRGARAVAPHGDMMISGCFGLLDAFAYRVPAARDAIAELHREAAP